MLCFRKIPVAKSLWIREGGYQDFPYSFFVSQCGKIHFLGKSLSVSLILSIENVFWIREGENQAFPSILFYITVPKKTVGVDLSVFLPFMVSKKFG